MSSRQESKKAAREARLAAEKDAASKEGRQRVWALVGGSVLLAAIVVIALIVISSGGSDDNGSDTGDAAVFDGIAQTGNELGDPDAPVTIVEYADLQCPFCKEYTANVLPDLVEKYVKSGDVRMELNLLTFIGTDSQTLAAAAYGAGQQDLMWQWADIAYARQGAENSGYADSSFIDSVSEAAGADVAEVNDAAGSSEVSDDITKAADAAQAAGVSSTPTFEIGPTGGDLTVLNVNQLETSAFEDAIDQQLADAKK
ncbi:MAG: thioredoxin domain-containing protein [Solirubrobacterales bacterium]